MFPSGSPMKGIASTSAKLHCELTTITEEMGGPSSPLIKDKPSSISIELSVLVSKVENAQPETAQVEESQLENAQVEESQPDNTQVEEPQLEIVQVENVQLENVQEEITQPSSDN